MQIRRKTQRLLIRTCLLTCSQALPPYFILVFLTGAYSYAVRSRASFLSLPTFSYQPYSTSLVHVRACLRAYCEARDESKPAPLRGTVEVVVW